MTPSLNPICLITELAFGNSFQHQGSAIRHPPTSMLYRSKGLIRDTFITTFMVGDTVLRYRYANTILHYQGPLWSPRTSQSASRSRLFVSLSDNAAKTCMHPGHEPDDMHFCQREIVNLARFQEPFYFNLVITCWYVSGICGSSKGYHDLLTRSDPRL